MIIEIKDELKMLTHTFVSSEEFKMITSCSPNYYMYETLSNQYEIDWLLTTTNLVDGGSSVSNSLQIGVNQDGSDFYANSWDALHWSLTFKPSSQERLANLRKLLRYKNSPLTVTITTGTGVYKSYCILESKNIETGEISFSSAFSDEKGYWFTGTVKERVYLRPVSEKGFVQTIPNLGLGYELQYDGDYTIFNISSACEIEVPIKISFVDFASTSGENAKFKHVNTGNHYTVKNVGHGNIEIYDSTALTHTLNSTTLPDPLQYMFTTGGNDVFEFRFKGNSNNSAYIEIEYDNYVIGVT